MTSILSKYNNLTQRIITAFFGAAIILGGIWYGPWTYFIVFLVICIFTQLEFYRLSGLDGMIPLKTFGTFSGVLIFSLSFFIEQGLLAYQWYLVIFPVISCIYMIKLYKKFERKPFTNIAFTFLGIFY
ncbi:MAG TPA: phosphatidate cytidylyltransferase, partial [Cyclobacteriaceae bacterium]|nr:phosphatidate cytidylyltransferase [Cyclobacteriaceae bacterium]